MSKSKDSFELQTQRRSNAKHEILTDLPTAGYCRTF
jgi:hypothetical protein